MYECICGKCFEKKSSLSSHARFCALYVKEERKSKYIEEDGSYKCECGIFFKKSQSLNSHFSRCLIHRKGKPGIYRGNGGCWNKGLKKKDHPAIAKFAKTLSEQKIGNPGHKHSEETKRILSMKRTHFLETHPGNNIDWYIVNNGEKDIKVQGKWEKEVAEWLNRSLIKWDRHRVKYDNHRTYTPDFWLPEHNCYIEVKGWMKKRDIDKMKKVIKETGIKIKILSKQHYHKINDLSLNELLDFNN